MPAGHYMTPDDVRIAREDHRILRGGGRPRRAHRRRRNPGGRGPSPLPIVSGWLIKTIPEGSVVADAITLETWNGVWFSPEVDDENNKIKYGGINSGFQPLRGSEAEPVAIKGVKRTYEDTDAEGNVELKTYIEIINPFDPAILPGHSKFTENGKPQGGFHKDGDRRYYADGGPCVDA